MEMCALRNRKAAGLGGLPFELLKYSGAAGVSTLTHLFNVVYESGCVSASWRQGVVGLACTPGDALPP